MTISVDVQYRGWAAIVPCLPAALVTLDAEEVDRHRWDRRAGCLIVALVDHLGGVVAACRAPHVELSLQSRGHVVVDQPVALAVVVDRELDLVAWLRPGGAGVQRGEAGKKNGDLAGRVPVPRVKLGISPVPDRGRADFPDTDLLGGAVVVAA